jgi:hypothetical protein
MVAAKREMDEAAVGQAKKSKWGEKTAESDDEDVVCETPPSQNTERVFVEIPVKPHPGGRIIKPETPVEDDRSMTIGIDDNDALMAWEASLASKRQLSHQ